MESTFFAPKWHQKCYRMRENSVMHIGLKKISCKYRMSFLSGWRKGKESIFMLKYLIWAIFMWVNIFFLVKVTYNDGNNGSYVIVFMFYVDSWCKLGIFGENEDKKVSHCFKSTRI